MVLCESKIPLNGYLQNSRVCVCNDTKPSVFSALLCGWISVHLHHCALTHKHERNWGSLLARNGMELPAGWQIFLLLLTSRQPHKPYYTICMLAQPPDRCRCVRTYLRLHTASIAMPTHACSERLPTIRHNSNTRKSENMIHKVQTTKLRIYMRREQPLCQVRKDVCL